MVVTWHVIRKDMNPVSEDRVMKIKSNEQHRLYQNQAITL